MSHEKEEGMTLAQAASLIAELKRDLAHARISDEGRRYFENLRDQARAHRERIEAGEAAASDPNLKVLKYLEGELRGILALTRGALH
ncbi:MAG TPA: hypothetical protein VGI93_03960 [Steroidobacteraceae bacterium]|jgi:DNA-binding PadR family transcriptional regulator